MSFLNVEIKAKCPDPDRVRRYLEAAKADFKGIDHQIDTYFNVQNGRLKLREGNIEHHLIHYTRPDQEGPKTSVVQLYRPNPGPELKNILTAAQGVWVVVDKKRGIYFMDNVKFHIDQVDGLGSFVEIEAIDRTGEIEEAALLEQCQFYLRELGIQESDLVAVSYSDLLSKKQ